MATHSSILAWEILWTEDPGRLRIRGVTKRQKRTQLSNAHFHTFPLSAHAVHAVRDTYAVQSPRTVKCLHAD